MGKASTESKRNELFNKVIQSLKLKSPQDNSTTCTREDALSALGTIKEIRQDIIENFPSTNTLKCRQGVNTDKDVITVLRQLARFYDKRVVSYRLKVPGSRGRLHKYLYKLAI